jgi:hypothetical protein
MVVWVAFITLQTTHQELILFFQLSQQPLVAMGVDRTEQQGFLMELVEALVVVALEQQMVLVLEARGFLDKDTAGVLLPRVMGAGQVQVAVAPEVQVHLYQVLMVELEVQAKLSL